MATTLFAQEDNSQQQQQQQFLIWTQQCLSFLVVGALWGCSNAVLKQCTEQQQDGEKAAAGPAQKSTKKQKAMWTGLQALIGTKAASLAFLVNQSGSLVYYYLLGSCEISLAVPICNSLTFVFTAITSHMLGERLDNPLRASLGVALVLVGVSLCVASK